MIKLKRKEDSNKKAKKGYSIYYAHHRWKYGTTVEDYELRLIRKYFPTASIFNPSIDLDVGDRSEEDIMKDCLETVKNSDILIFSSLDGSIGTGVYREICKACEEGKLVMYIYHDTLRTDWNICMNHRPDKSDRIHAFVNVKSFE